MTDGACPSADKGDCTNTVSLGKPSKNGTIWYRIISGLFYNLYTPPFPQSVPL